MATPNATHVLRIIPDKKGHSVAKKLYEAYIMGEGGDEGDGIAYARLPEFTIALDKLLSEFGARPLPPSRPDEDEDDDEQGDGDPTRREDQEYGDDEDIHETASYYDIEAVKAAVAKVLGK